MGVNFDRSGIFGAQLADILSEDYNIYGTFWDKSPSPTLTRIDSARGAIANAGVDAIPAYNQFDATPLFKDFKEVTDSYGNVFIRIPKMYIKKVDGTNYRTWQISRKPFDGAYLPWCFWDFTNNKELDYIDVGKYKATLSDDGTKLESKAGKYPLINKTIADFRNYAKANNINGLKGYQQLDIHVWDLLQVVFLIEFATLNGQSICTGYSNGQYENTHVALISEAGANRIVVSNANGALYAVGQAISVGTTQGGNQRFYGRTITAINVDTPSAGQTAIVFDGTPVDITTGDMLYNTGWKNGFSSNISASVGSLVSNSDGKHPFVWHGIESLFGDIWQFVDGVNITDMQAWVCKNADNYASNVFASPYEQLGYVNANADGYTSAMGFDALHPFAEFPTAVTGSTSTYYSDYQWHQTGQRIARAGGGWFDGSHAGLFCWALSNASSSTNMDFGGRLLKKPL